jgi:hypothetical protein
MEVRMSDINSLGCIEINGEFYEVYDEYETMFFWAHDNGEEPVDYDDLCDNNYMSIRQSADDHCVIGDNVTRHDFALIQTWCRTELNRTLPDPINPEAFAS